MLSFGLTLLLLSIWIPHSYVLAGHYNRGLFDLVVRAKYRQEIEESVNNLHSFATSLGNESVPDLTQQYIHGFDGRIDFILSKHSMPLDSLEANTEFVKLSTKTLPVEQPIVDKVLGDRVIVGQATNLKLLLAHYRKEYANTLKPMHFGVTTHHLQQVRFDRFITLHEKCMHLMSELESIIPNLDRKFYYVLEGEIGNFKFMMEQIGSDINYPGLSNLGLNTERCLNISLWSTKIWNNQPVRLKNDGTMSAMIAIRNAIPNADLFCQKSFAFLQDVNDFIVMPW